MSEEPKKTTRRKPAAPSTRISQPEPVGEFIATVKEETVGTAVQLSDYADKPEVVTLPKPTTRRFTLNTESEAEKKLKKWIEEFIGNPETVIDTTGRHHLVATGNGVTVKILSNHAHVSISRDGFVGEVVEGVLGTQLIDIIHSAHNRRNAEQIEAAKNTQLNNIMGMIGNV